MSDKYKQLSRNDLYEMVWQTPLIKLAGELGLSDRAIAKKCKHYNIPTPGIGYWAKLQAGQKLTKKELPSLDSDITNPIVLIIHLERRSEPPLSHEILKAGGCLRARYR